MLKVDSLFKSFGALLATDNLSFQVKKGDIHAIIGPNGAGKTTTIAKMAHNYKKDGFKVILGAGDTFRAAAVEQLNLWAEKIWE